MKTAAKYLLCGAVFVASGLAPAMAADIYEPPVIETPIYQAPEHVPAAVSGWYLRGDVGFAWHQKKDAHYVIATGCGSPCATFLEAPLFAESFRGSYTFGAGVGYKFNNYMRADVTLDWWRNGQFTGHPSGT